MLFQSFFLLCFRARLFIEALRSPTGKGLTSWLSFVMTKRPLSNYRILPVSRDIG